MKRTRRQPNLSRCVDLSHVESVTLNWITSYAEKHKAEILSLYSSRCLSKNTAGINEIQEVDFLLAKDEDHYILLCFVAGMGACKNPVRPSNVELINVDEWVLLDIISEGLTMIGSNGRLWDLSNTIKIELVDWITGEMDRSDSTVSL